jgi:hypothetical protein
MSPSARTRSSKDIAEIDSLKRKVADLQSQLNQSKSASPESSSRSTETSQGHQIDTIGSLSLHDTELSLVEESRSTFLGPSSAAAFATTPSEDEYSEDEYSDTDSQAEDHTFPFQSSSKSNWANLTSVLPDRQEADRLAQLYFNSHGIVFEAVPEPAFQSLYLHTAYGSSVQRLRMSTPGNINPVDVQRLAVVYGILAIGALFDETKPARSKQAKTYFVAAQRCLGITHFLFSPSMASVQALHLFTSFIFLTHRHSFVR